MKPNYLYLLFCVVCFSACGFLGEEPSKRVDDKTSATTPKESTKVLTEKDFFDWTKGVKDSTTKENWITKLEKMKTETDPNNPNDTKIKQRQIANILSVLGNTTNIDTASYSKQKTDIKAAKDSIHTRYTETHSVIENLLKCFIYKPTATPALQVTPTDQNKNDANNRSPETSYLSWFSYILCVALFAFLFYKWQIAESKIKRLREALKKAKEQQPAQTMTTTYPPVPEITPENKETNKDKNRRLEQERQAAERQRREDADRQRREAAQRQQEEADRKREAERLAALPPPIIRTLYLSTPQSDGSFRVEHATESYQQGQSVYKLELISNSKGDLSFISDAFTLSSALNLSDSFIAPVCKERNTGNARTREIKTRKKGIAVLENDKWRVSERVEIEYIS